jgi:ribosomal protein L33
MPTGALKKAGANGRLSGLKATASTGVTYTASKNRLNTLNRMNLRRTICRRQAPSLGKRDRSNAADKQPL